MEPALKQPRRNKHTRKLSGDLSAAGFDFIDNLLNLLDACGTDGLTPSRRARLDAMLSLIPILYPRPKAIDPCNTMTIPRVAQLLEAFAREHGIEGPLNLPSAWPSRMTQGSFALDVRNGGETC